MNYPGWKASFYRGSLSKLPIFLCIIHAISALLKFSATWLSSFRSIILPNARPDLPSHSQHGLPNLSSKSCADLSLLDPSLSLQHCWSPIATMALSHSPIGMLSPQEVREGLQPASHKVVRVWNTPRAVEGSRKPSAKAHLISPIVHSERAIGQFTPEDGTTYRSFPHLNEIKSQNAFIAVILSSEA